MTMFATCLCLGLAISLITAFIGIWLFFQKQFKHWDKYNIPHTKPKFPFGDLGLEVFHQCFAISLDKIYKSFEKEKVIGIWSACQPILIVKDLDVVKDVLVKEFMSFHDRGMPVDEENDPLSAHLFSIGGKKWRNLRAKLSPAFTSGKIKMMIPILVECGNEMVSVLEPIANEKGIVEAKDVLSRFTTDVISSCAFGIESNTLRNPNSEFRSVGKSIIEPSFVNSLRSFVILIPRLAKLLGIRLFPADTSEFFLNAVRETMDYREKNNVKRNDFMQLLIQLMNKGKLDDIDEVNKGFEEEDEINKHIQKFTFEEAAAQAFIFFLGGFETSSATLQFSLYELALQPEIQERLRVEIKSVLARYNGEITYEAIFEMDYLGRVIDETLRKYPINQILFRQCNKDYKIPDTKMMVPKGTIVQIPIYSIQRDPNLYPDPERFDPDRFTEKAKSQRHHFAYLPFGEGPRHCIGTRFAYMQIRVGLVKLLQNYQFEICEKSPVPMKFSRMTLTPKEGMHLRISKVM